jgi:hypothetical protein
MREPTVSEDKILNEVYEKGTVFLNNSDVDIQKYWVLVRTGYLKNLVSFSHDWSFKLSGEGLEYVQG